MTTLVCLFTGLPALLHLIIKGHCMEGHIDKIDVKRDHKELIALFYRMELLAFTQVLLYAHSIKEE